MPIHYLKSLGIFSLVLVLFSCVCDGYSISKRQAPSLAPCQRHDSSRGSTPGIETIFKGRCAEFQNVLITPELCPGIRVDCDDAWNRFVAAFVGKDPCDIDADAYQEFLMAVPILFPPNQTLFWSGTNEFSHDYTKIDEIYYTLEQSMPGYMLNGLKWCSSMGSSSLNINGPCPEWNAESCPNTAEGVYWGSASSMLAKQTRGVATIFLNGSSTRDAFRTNSFFGSRELPNLNMAKVSRLRIIVAHNIGGPINERCGTKSIKDLEEMVKKRGIPYSCENSPETVRLLQCVTHPDDKACDIERFTYKTRKVRN